MEIFMMRMSISSANLRMCKCANVRILDSQSFLANKGEIKFGDPIRIFAHSQIRTLLLLGNSESFPIHPYSQNRQTFPLFGQGRFKLNNSFGSYF